MRDHLPTPATSVGPERIFNLARDVVTYRRCHLKPAMIRKLVMMKHGMLSCVGDEAEDQEELEDDMFDSGAVRKDMVWAWQTDLISEGSGDEEEVLELEEELGGEDGDEQDRAGDGIEEESEFRHVDDVANWDGDDDVLPDLLDEDVERASAQETVGLTRAGTRSMSYNQPAVSKFFFLQLCFNFFFL